MPKFTVTVMRDVLDEAFIEVEAADETAAKAAAMARVETDETIEWEFKDTMSIEVLDVSSATA